MKIGEDLIQKVAQMPQADLGHFPTPLEECPRLSEVLGGPRIFMKREDCSGLAFGGNKVRQLTFTLGDAVAQGVYPDWQDSLERLGRWIESFKETQLFTFCGLSQVNL